MTAISDSGTPLRSSLEAHLIGAGAPLVEALAALNRLSGESMTLFVTDAEGALLGSLTDGDVRRALLGGAGLSDAVASVCNRRYLFLRAGEPDVAVIADARAKGIMLLPVVSGNRPVALFDLRERRSLIPADGVLMAGGAGERLRPLTLTVPKPLLPVGGRPIIDHNVALLRRYGIDRIFVTVNYLRSMIESHFAGCPGVECVAEPVKLGTIGSLSLVEGLKAPNVVVMNADLLTDVNLEAMYLRHIESEAWLTMAVVPYTVSVPFAIVSHEGDRVTGLVEKPSYNHYANAGIYMLRREALAFIPKGEFMDATDLVESLLRASKRVSMYCVDGRWIDIGSPDDYRHACEVSL